MLNALSSHSKLNNQASSQRLSGAAATVTSPSVATTCSPSSTISKMNLSGANQQQNALGLNLNLSSSSDSSSNGAGNGGLNNTNNNHSHQNHHSTNHHSHTLASFHNQLLLQQQQQQQQLQQLAGNQQVESIEANKGYTFEEQFKQLYELSDDPKRKEFLDDLFQFMADRNQPVNRIPIMAKQVLDLYELYNLVVARGGLVEVINKKIWREITKGLNLPSSITSAAFTLRTQYMKYLYPYECAKNNFSHQDELQQAIDGNRREGRRAGATSLGGYASYMGTAGSGAALDSSGQLGHYSASPSPNHLFAGHNLIAAAQAAAAQVHQNQSAHQQLKPLHLHQDLRDQQRPQSRSSSASPSTGFNQQRLYQDSIESDHEDEDGSIDLGHSSKRNSPIDHENQHLDPHNNHHINQQQATEQQQLAAAAAAAAIRQQLGAAINFAGSQNFLGQLSNQSGNQNPNSNPNSNATNTNSTTNANQQGDLLKQQQEQFLAALTMAAANQQQQQPGATAAPDQQATARAALSMMASNAMLIAASNAPDAMAIAAAAQAIGVKGAFIILLL